MNDKQTYTFIEFNRESLVSFCRCPRSVIKTAIKNSERDKNSP